MRPPLHPPTFTMGDGLYVLRETEVFLACGRGALRAGRYVEALGWIQRAGETLSDQDIFGSLAAGEETAAIDAAIDADRTAVEK